jgi:hypothetical protein
LREGCGLIVLAEEEVKIVNVVCFISRCELVDDISDRYCVYEEVPLALEIASSSTRRKIDLAIIRTILNINSYFSTPTMPSRMMRSQMQRIGRDGSVQKSVGPK